jgi:hypothetical protein
MKNMLLINRLTTLGVALICAGFVGTSYAAGSSAPSSQTLRVPGQVVSATGALHGISGATFDPPPDNEGANEVTKVVQELLAESQKGTTPLPAGGFPGGIDPFPGLF